MKMMLPLVGTRIAFACLLALGFSAAPQDGSTPGQKPRAPQLDLSSTVSVKGLDLSRAPTTEELIAAGQLGGPLFPTHQLADKAKAEAANLAFGQAIEEWNKHEYPKGVALFRKYLEQYPDSPWAAEAALHIGCDASYNGRYTEAEALFNKLIQDNQGKSHFGAKMMLNKARQRLALLKVEQNNLPEASAMFSALLQDSPDWRHRTYASHWIQRLSRFAAAKQALLNCGAEALAYALEKEGHKAAAAGVGTNIPSTMKGHSLASLSQIAADNGFQMLALKVTAAELSQLPLPAILHVNARNPGDKGHYWVLDKIQGRQVELFDPQSRHRFHQTTEEFTREWTGNVLVFSKGATLPGRRLDLGEMEESSGGCCGAPRNEDGLGDPGEDGDGSNECSEGAPRWAVNVISMNLYVTDTPMWYTPPIGPPVRITLSYNSQSAIAHNQPFGNKWQFSYGSYLVVDTAATVTLFMPDGRRDVFAPDGAGGYVKPYRVYNTLTQLGANHFELRHPDDTVYVYQIPPGTTSQQPFLVEIRDAHGQKLSFAYDANVHLTTITDAQARITRLNYNASGLVSSVTDPFGRIALFQYDGNHNLINITDMGGYSSSFGYDTNIYLARLGDARGTYAFYVEPADGIYNGSDPYPSPGALMWENYRITITDPLGHPAEYHYNGYSGYSWYVRPRDYVPYASQYENNFRKSPKTRFDFERTGSGRQGEIRLITFPENDYVVFEHDTAGNVTYMNDAHGHYWFYIYNDMGLVTSETDPRGTRVTFSYATNNVDRVSVSDGLGQLRFAYNTQHDALSFTDRLTNRTSFGYNGFGQLIAVTNAAGTRDEYVYNADHFLTQVLRGGQPIRTFTYDATNRVRTYTDATGLTRAYDYNNLDQITRITYPDGKSESYVYSACCPRMLDSMTDRGGRTTTFVHDVLKQLVQITNPDGAVAQFVYDMNGNRTQLIDENGNVTGFEFNLDDRLIRKTYADGGIISFAYDVAGLLTNRTNARGAQKRSTYDENHNLVSITYSDNTPGVTNTYDAFNRRVKAVHGTGTNTYSYDANSQLIASDGPWATDTITCAFDALGRRTNLTAQLGQAVGYAYDALDRLTQVRTGAGNYTYAYSGASPMVQRLTRPNTSYSTYQYDNLNRLTGVANKNSANQILSQFLYAYDAADLRAGETITNALGHNFTTNQLVTGNYNELNQLLSASSPAQTFAYDPDGNLVRGYTPGGYLFRASYDAENRLNALVYTNGAGVTCSNVFTYAANAWLSTWKQFTNGVVAGETRFVRDGYLPLQERDGANTLTRQYAWGDGLGGGIGGLVNLTQAAHDYAYIYDGKGNVIAVLDNAQAVVASYSYDSFGNVMARTDPLDQPFQFSTKRNLKDTGLVYFGYRFYCPALGRWASRDPLEETAGLNLYEFVGGDPISRVDPFGLEPPFKPAPQYGDQSKRTPLCSKCVEDCVNDPKYQKALNQGLNTVRMAEKARGCKSKPGILATIARWRSKGIGEMFTEAAAGVARQQQCEGMCYTKPVCQ